MKKKEFQGMFEKLVCENIHSAFKAKFQFSRQTDISQTWMLGSRAREYLLTAYLG